MQTLYNNELLTLLKTVILSEAMNLKLTISRYSTSINMTKTFIYVTSVNYINFIQYSAVPNICVYVC